MLEQGLGSRKRADLSYVFYKASSTLLIASGDHLYISVEFFSSLEIKQSGRAVIRSVLQIAGLKEF